MNKELVTELNNAWKDLDIVDLLKAAHEQFKDRLTLASSLGAEDQVLTHLFANTVTGCDVFVLDTGRLNDETYDVLSKSKERYQCDYRVFFPNNQAIEMYVSDNGPNAFYESIEKRQACCSIRKVQPLKRALDGYDMWITGFEERSPLHECLQS